MIIQEKFNIICWIWILIALMLFPVLLNVAQPYGKHTKNNWGYMINNKLGWFFMELPALLVFAYFVIFFSGFHNKITLVAASLWGLHYVHRSIIFPLRIRTKGKKMPVIIMLFAIIFNSVNGFLNGYWLANFVPPETGSLPVKIRLVIGAIIFLTGFVLNQYHDWLLIKLRKKDESGYKIPFGGLFKYVSCPNFLGEIISWLGFLIVTLSLPALSFLIWTMVNLISRAIDHHKWYRSQFQEYPSERKAIIPFVL